MNFSKQDLNIKIINALNSIKFLIWRSNLKNNALKIIQLKIAMHNKDNRQQEFCKINKIW